MVLGIVSLLVGLGVLGSMDAYRSYVFTSEQHTVVSMLEKVRSRALVHTQHSAHGVCYQAPYYILFQGSDCVSDAPSSEHVLANRWVARASDFDTTFPTVIFTSLTATTVPTTIEMTDGVRTKDILINYEGAIFW